MADFPYIPDRAKQFFAEHGGTVAGQNLLVLYEEGRIDELTIEAAKAYCQKCEVGTHKCSVQTRYGWCCDLCIEEELLALKLCGVHTVNSCCGHGNRQLASILVAGEESRDMMQALGYEMVGAVPEHRMTNWQPKTLMIYELGEEYNG
ncbi:MAG: hypothetical protein LIO70_01260 [Clostridiales bacterium]|nr:hypothetical protein [Clostridiales bacterium]